MEIDLRKTATDAAYIAVGAGVLGFQQAQVRRREASERITAFAKDAQDALGRSRARTLARWWVDLPQTLQRCQGA